MAFTSMVRSWASFAGIFATLLGVAAGAEAQALVPHYAMAKVTSAGTPDTGFGGGDGQQTTTLGYCGAVIVRDVAMRAGKFAVTGLCGATGDWQGGSFVVRYNASGTGDGNFTITGAISVPGILANAIAIDSSDRVVLAGEKDGKIALARITPRGNMDPDFGGGGISITELSAVTGETASAVAIQSDGKIVVAGEGAHPTSGVIFVVARFSSYGLWEKAALTNFGSSSEEVARNVAIAPDGKIVVGGHCKLDGQGWTQFAAARYTTALVLDTTFDGDGKVIIDLPNAQPDYGYGVGVDSKKRVVIAGLSWYPDARFALARVTESGALDTSFGSGGVVNTNFASATAEGIFDLKVLAGDKLLVSGEATLSGHQQFAAARYNANGSLDTSFDADGKVLVNITNSADEAGEAVAYDAATGSTLIVGPTW